MKIKPCPFCGSSNIGTQSGTGLDLNTQYNGRYIFCFDCRAFMEVKSYLEWNIRTDPIREQMYKALKKWRSIGTEATYDIARNMADEAIKAYEENQF